MRAMIGRILVATGLASLLLVTPASPATAAEDDILDRLLAIEGVSLIQEKPVQGYRYFVLNFTQAVDHRRPDGDTFQQRFTVLHKDTARPTVFQTSGYGVSTNPGRSEPTRIVDGNQVSMEYRFFTPSRPAPADWDDLDIWQGASDQHAIFEALEPIYGAKWLSTGGSKGGMTATYYERFYPSDMDGVVAYVAPNDVVDREDSAYDDFFATVGTEDCRNRINGVQREALVRREALKATYADMAAKEGYTFKTVGSLDSAYEMVVLDFAWAYWQYAGTSACSTIPADAATATDQQIWDVVDNYSGFSFYTDQGLSPYTPYYYQAGTELGAPTIGFPHIEDDLIRYGYQAPRSFVPREIDMRFDPSAMRDIDSWVRKHANQMLFVNGEADPWGAEPFRLGAKAKDSYVFTAPGMNHGANVAGLVADERELATARILEWAGVATAAVEADPAKAKPLAAYDAKLDKRDLRQERSMRP